MYPNPYSMSRPNNKQKNHTIWLATEYFLEWCKQVDIYEVKERPETCISNPITRPCRATFGRRSPASIDGTGFLAWTEMCI